MAKLVYGFGYNGNRKSIGVSGTDCAYEYSIWTAMLKRCYSDLYHSYSPTYIGCKVCDEWHDFEVFLRWVVANHPRDDGKYCLDKDLISPGNREYHPDKCIFISQSLNKFAIDSNRRNGDVMTGASFHKRIGKFSSYCKNPFTNKLDHLGYFIDELNAHLAWREKKYEHAIKLAELESRKVVKNALIGWAESLRSGLIHTNKTL